MRRRQNTMKMILRVLVGVVLIAGVIVGVAAPAEACSCAPPNIAEAIASSDGAIIATMIERFDTESSAGFSDADIATTFAVETWVKGEGANVLAVWGPSDGGACGIEARPGQRVGLFLRQQGPRVVSSLCETVSADLLAAATSGEIIVGSGPAAFALAGAFDEGAIALLDAEGLPVGYLGEPVEWSRPLVPCPGGSTVLQVDDTEIVVTDLRTGEQRSIVPPMSGESYITSAICGDGDGAGIRFLVEQWAESRSRHELWEADPEPRRLGQLPVEGGGGQPILAAETVVIIQQDDVGARLQVFDPASGFLTTVSETARGDEDNAVGYDRPAVSADGRRVVANEIRFPGDGPVRSRVIVFDAGDGQILSEKFYDRELYAQWVGDEFIGAGHSLDSDATLAVLRANDLEVHSEISGWDAETGPVSDGQLWGLSYGGSTLFRASLDGGEVERVTTFGAVASGRPVRIAEPIDPPADLVEPRSGVEIAEGGLLESELPEGDGESSSGGRSATRWWVIGGLVLGLVAGLGIAASRR